DGLLVVTRTDLADPRPALDVAGQRLARSSLGAVEAVAVSAATGAGLDGLRTALGRLVDALPRPVIEGRVRFWIDRSFSVRGAGTVVTGTLGAGTLRVGDQLELNGRAVTIRGLEETGRRQPATSAVARVGVNLRGIGRDDVRRGDVLVTPDRWPSTTQLDVRMSVDPRELPGDVVLHVGTAALAVHVRPLDARLARLTLPTALPLVRGDRAMLRDPGRQAVAAGLEVLDVDPPELRRRGAAVRRAAELTDAGADPVEEVRRRGAVRRADLLRLGVAVAQLGSTSAVVVVGEWLVADATWSDWAVQLRAAVDRRAAEQPLQPGLTHEAARRALGLPSRDLLPALVGAAGLEQREGRVIGPDSTTNLGRAEPALRRLEARLAQFPFDAPTVGDLDGLGLGRREIAAAIALGRLVRVGGVLLAPDAPARAARILADLPQPFTTSAARQALGSTRRTVIPLLEHLDGLGATVRLDAGRRRVAG
ncbi:MAG: SelB C-terminal domain-containing protein, partial [Actinomycetota bacterium]|nr:SelB C-terminal domain-containing protein [Actinomycetota bacterium]